MKIPASVMIALGAVVAMLILIFAQLVSIEDAINAPATITIERNVT